MKTPMGLWADEEYRSPDPASTRKFNHFRGDAKA